MSCVLDEPSTTYFLNCDSTSNYCYILIGTTWLALSRHQIIAPFIVDLRNGHHLTKHGDHRLV
jgi:hypothetical protein